MEMCVAVSRMIGESADRTIADNRLARYLFLSARSINQTFFGGYSARESTSYEL